MTDFAPSLVQLCRRQPQRARLVKCQLQVLKHAPEETLKAIYQCLLETETITEECFGELRRLRNELKDGRPSDAQLRQETMELGMSAADAGRYIEDQRRAEETAELELERAEGETRR